MTAPSSGIREFLADDEPVIYEVSGTLIDRSRRSVGFIGVTDRRVLFRSNGDRFMDIAHGAIHSIQSRPRVTFTHRGIGYRLLVALGVIVAASAFLGVIALNPGVLALGLMSLTVGGGVGAEYVRRYGHDEPEGGSPLRRYEGLLAVLGVERGGSRELRVVSLVFLASIALIGLIALTESLFVVPLVLVTLAGIALGDYANRRKRELDEIGGGRRLEREVSIHLASGRSVHIRVDAAERIDHELSRSVRETEGGTADIGLAQAEP